MINSSANINFKPNYYNFNPVDVSIEVKEFKEEIPNLTSIFKSKFISSGELDVISACKYTETILGLRMINSGFSIEYVATYLEFLLDLNRFEEAFDLCSQLIPASPVLNTRFFQKYLIEIALCMEEPHRIDHLMPDAIEPDASVDEWFYFIHYHMLKGTQHSLLLKPLPSNQSAKCYLYYVLEDYSKIISIYPPIPSSAGDVLTTWIAWLANKRLNQTTTANNLLIVLTTFKYKTNRIIEDLIFEDLQKEKPFSQQIGNFIENYKYYRLFNPKLLLAAAQFIPEKAISYRSQAKKIVASFSNLPNKRFLIKAGDAKEAQKMSLLAKTVMVATPRLSHISELLSFYKNKAEESLDICQQVEKYNVRGALKIQVVATYSYFAESPKERENALAKVEKALIDTPHSKTLHLHKITLLTKLNRLDEAEIALKEAISLIGYDQSFTILVKNLYEKTGDLDSGIKLLKQFYKENPDERCLNLLIDLYVKQKSKKEWFNFLVEYVFPNNQSFDLDTMFQEAKDIIFDMEDQARGVELLLTVKRGINLRFLSLRASFLYEKGEYEKALEDVDYLCEKNVEDARHSKISLLIQLARYTEAVRLVTTLKLAISDDLTDKLISALENEDGWAEEIILIGEKLKPKSYDARKSVAYAYATNGDFEKALPIFNKLKSEESDDVDVLNGRVLCLQAKKMYATAIDQLNEILVLEPNNTLSRTLLSEILAAQASTSNKTEKPESVDKPVSRKQRQNTGSVPILIESDKEISAAKLAHQKKAAQAKVKSTPIHLQKTPSRAVDPLTYDLHSLKAIKEIARRGEKETEIPEVKAPVIVESSAQLKPDAPKLLVNPNLRDFERVFLNRGLDALRITLLMNPSQYEPKVVFNNYIYAILRVFTPIRLNAVFSNLKEDLRDIRDCARHESDLIVYEKLIHLFTYIKDINLEGQLADWINGKSAITKLCLKPYRLVEQGIRKPPIERIMIELDFIRKKTGDKETWHNRIYDRNAIKASLSIIGEASNFLSDELKIEFAAFREEGNKVAHAFFEDGDTFEYTEKYKEEEIQPEALWELAQKGIELYKKLTRTAG